MAQPATQDADATDLPELPFPTAPIEEMLRTLVKGIRAHQLYLQNNPIYQRSIDQLRGSFAPIWENTSEILLVITELEIRWMGRPVLSEAEKSSDSLPWLFYKDGIREITLREGFEVEEVVSLLNIIKRLRNASPDEDDLLTMLWEQDFLLMRYRFVDLTVEGAPAMEASDPGSRPVQVASPREEDAVAQAAAQQNGESESEEAAPRPGVVNLEDFDATLYFLDATEIEYLQSEIRTEYLADLRRNVLCMLLDIFELQTDARVRDEVGSLLEEMMLRLLSAGEFGAVAFLLRETEQAMRRARELLPPQRERLSMFPARLSQRETLAQLLQSLDEAASLPAQADLDALFAQFRGEALETIFAWLGRLQNPRVRELLEQAAARLAETNTSEVVRLITASDAGVASEAIRRAGALKMQAAVPGLGKVIAERDAALRLVAVQALAEVASPGAMQTLERTVDDADRDVRVATVRAIAARSHRQALGKLEAKVSAKGMRELDLTEKMALFEAYGALCGEGGVSYLDGLLNGKGFLGRREDPETRACAAMALGRIRSEPARAALQRASTEKEIVVRNAVNKALRAGAV